MQYIRPASDRGRAHFSWLNSFHSFSFGQYYDPAHMGISALRVINDDTVVPGAGFDTHGHRNMEIISYILNGTIEHRDSAGNTEQLHAGELQRMSAGSGIRHSEYNASDDKLLRFLQIWIEPNVLDIQPEYEQMPIPDSKGVHLLLSPDGEDSSLKLHQDARMYQVKIDAQEEIELPLHEGNAYLHVIQGKAELLERDASLTEKIKLEPGDAVGGPITKSSRYLLKAEYAGPDPLIVLWFLLP